MRKLILSLCDYSGAWSRPYAEAGYEVVRVDLQNGEDVRLLKATAERAHGVLAAPPCQHLARSGAPHWRAKGEAAIIEGMAVVDACLLAVIVHKPEWWAMENPVGRLRDYLGPPSFRFNPCDFGDPWTKRTWLWGHFTPPMPLYCPSARPVAPTRGDVTTKMSSRDANGRSLAPSGFARAFFEANP